jgi:hypothetical protein
MRELISLLHSLGLQVEALETSWRNANDIRTGTGQGVFDAAFAQKAAKNWDDNSPEWLREKKVALGMFSLAFLTMAFLSFCLYFTT